MRCHDICSPRLHLCTANSFALLCRKFRWKDNRYLHRQNTCALEAPLSISAYPRPFDWRLLLYKHKLEQAGILLMRPVVPARMYLSHNSMDNRHS